MSAAVWSGLAVFDAAGRIVIWKGSYTPKLYHSEEQAIRIARPDGHALEAVTLVRGTITELIGPASRRAA